jgi:hypothetical protein
MLSEGDRDTTGVSDRLGKARPSQPLPVVGTAIGREKSGQFRHYASKKLSPYTPEWQLEIRNHIYKLSSFFIFYCYIFSALDLAF